MSSSSHSENIPNSSPCQPRGHAAHSLLPERSVRLWARAESPAARAVCVDQGITHGFEMLHLSRCRWLTSKFQKSKKAKAKEEAEASQSCKKAFSKARVFGQSSHLHRQWLQMIRAAHVQVPRKCREFSGAAFHVVLSMAPVWNSEQLHYVSLNHVLKSWPACNLEQNKARAHKTAGPQNSDLSHLQK